VRVHSDGKVTIFSGSHSHGQGHHTAFVQLAADALKLPMDDIELVQGDTDRVPFGNGTWGSRSASVGGVAIVMAAERVLGKARKFAAHLLKCAEEDLDYEDGVFKVRGTERVVSFAEIADIAYHGAGLPADRSLSPGLEETVFYDPIDTNDPQAMHLVVVIVDAETGKVRVRDYFTADDCGRIINPMIVEGQVHGGVTQGIGQALLEGCVYDDNGQLVTGSFMDYAMPRADNLPNYNVATESTPCTHNSLGVKGVGEVGAIGSPPAVINAVVDALSELGVTDVAMPATPQTVWRAIQAAG
jgi:carbon-monoxide dehydrogenase large subunit